MTIPNAVPVINKLNTSEGLQDFKKRIGYKRRTLISLSTEWANSINSALFENL